MSPVELRRIIAEWRLRVSRVKNILQPPSWSDREWRQFAQALALLVRDHGRSWILDPNVYWDLRWKLQDGGELVCQVEHIPTQKTSLVVAQTGGFATEVGSYTWLWAEFNMAGDFARDPYWVEGTWKEALTTLLLPLDRQSSYLLAGRTDTPASLLQQEGARPNDLYFSLPLMEGDRNRRFPQGNFQEGPPASPGAASWNGGAVEESPEPETVAYANGIEPDNHERTFSVPWEREIPARPPDGREARLRRRRAHLLNARRARAVEQRSYRRAFELISSMD
jgi:hypothetical protein